MGTIVRLRISADAQERATSSSSSQYRKLKMWEYNIYCLRKKKNIVPVALEELFSGIIDHNFRVQRRLR